MSLKTLEDEDMKSAFLAGFSLSGQRQADGTLKSHTTDCVLDDWPAEVAMCGNIYTLENVIKGNDGYECGDYV